MTEPELYNAEHFRRFAPDEGGILGRLEEEAREKDIPIVGPLLGKLLFVLARAMGARRVLELGTAVGYSAIWLGRAVSPAGGRVHTVEWDRDMAAVARANIKEAGLADIVEVHQGDAREAVASLRGEAPFDLVFQDVEKEMYMAMLDTIVEVMRPGALLVLDNTAFKSAGDFLEVSARHPALDTVHLYGFFPDHNPDFDAITICARR